MKVVCWDLECTSLSALMGHLLTSGFCEYLPKGASRNHHDTPPSPYIFRIDSSDYKGRTLLDDKKLAVSTRTELEGYDLIIGHNIRMFDIPFLNARLAKYDERPLNTHFVLDTMYFVGYQAMRIGSKKLDNVAKYFSLAEQKTDIDWETWQLAGTGDKKALDQVVEHNKQDVLVLRELYPKLLPYVKNLHR